MRVTATDFIYVDGDEIVFTQQKRANDITLGVILTSNDKSFCQLKANESHPKHAEFTKYFKQLFKI
jgi:hypothetical protein